MADISGHDPGKGPAPGWYDDPWMAGQVRWWNGTDWTAQSGPGPGGRGAPPPPPPTTPGMVTAGAYRADLSVADPERALADEKRLAGTASAALILGALGYVILFVAFSIFYHYLFHTIFDSLRDASRSAARSTTTRTGGTSTTTVIGAGPADPPHFSPLLLAASGLLQLVQFGLYAVGAIFLAWFYKAAQLARAANLPARRSPGLGTGGFIIPIVNLWWPYQSVCDLFPPGDPRRRVAGRWWALWLCTQFGTLPVMVASFGPIVLGVLVAMIMSGVAVAAAIAARRVVATVAEVHEEVVDRAIGRVR